MKRREERNLFIHKPGWRSAGASWGWWRGSQTADRELSRLLRRRSTTPVRRLTASGRDPE